MKDSFQNPKLTLAIDNIRGTFAGEYGGVKYVRFVQSISELERRALHGDKAAQELILTVDRFSRLIDAIIEPPYRGPEQA